MIEFLTEKQIKTLEALAVFQYLTAKQLGSCEISPSIAMIRNKILYPLANGNKPFVKYQSFAGEAGKGTLSRIYFLTKRGAEAVAEYQQIEPNQVHYPKGGVQFSNDYFHRVDCIDCHIALRKWAEIDHAEIEFFTSYFDKIGSNRNGQTPLTSKNRFLLNHKIFIPDGLTRLQHNGKHKLFALEVHRGNNTKRITEQLNRHIDAIHQGLITQKYQHKTANFVLSIYEKQSILEATTKRLLELADFKHFQRHFLFSTVEQVKAGFGTAFVYANGEKVTHLAAKQNTVKTGE